MLENKVEYLIGVLQRFFLLQQGELFLEMPDYDYDIHGRRLQPHFQAPRPPTRAYFRFRPLVIGYC